jgi:hypothetical protein
MIDQEAIIDAELVDDDSAGTAVAETRPRASMAVARHEEQIDGAWLLNLADAWIGRHCYMSDAARHTLALWTMAQHFRSNGRMIWEKFGHLLFIAETPGSGKSTAMTIGGYLCAPWFFGLDLNPTAPGLCMTIGQEHAVVCIDEAHRLIGPKGTKKADVVTIMCGSFEKNGSYLNGRGGKATRVRVWSPMMIAAKKDPFLTSAGEEISDVIDRSVLIMMSKPPADDDPENPALMPLTAETEMMGAQIAARAAAWAAQAMADPDRMRTAMAAARTAAAQTGLVGRDADVWLAMFTVAALASPGHLEVACQAAAELRLHRPAAQEVETDPLRELEAGLMRDGAPLGWGAAVTPARVHEVPVAAAAGEAAGSADPQILGDIADVWPDGEAKMASAGLVARLGWDVSGPDEVRTAQRELAALLKPHGVVPVKVRIGDRTVWGYRLADFPALAMAA